MSKHGHGSSVSVNGSIHDGIEYGQRNVEQSLASVVEAGQTLSYENAGYHNPSHTRLVDARDDDHDDPKDMYRHRVTTVTQGIIIFLIALMFAALFVLISVTSATYDKVDSYKASTTVTTVYQSVGLPGYEGYSWTDVQSAAAGDSVNWYTYDGPLYNTWIDTWLIPMVKDLYDINLVRVPISTTSYAVNKVIYEIQAGYGLNNGSVDMIWINGENFATLKNLGYAYGPWATKTPNAVNFDFTADEIEYDFGLQTAGLEMPYNEAQVAFIANEAFVNHTTINDITSLLAWIKGDGAGRFTYATPCASINSDGSPAGDPTGAVFIRHIFYSLVNYDDFLGSFNEDLYLQHAPAFYQLLRSLEPFLYTSTGLVGTLNTYPTRNEDVDALIADLSTYVTLAYDPGHATAQIENNYWANTVTGYVLSSGTIGNTNFVLIPSNARNKLAAVVVADFIASAEAMFSRAQPETIGTLQAYDESTTAFTSGGWNTAFSYIDRAASTPSKSSLDAYRKAELASAYIVRFNLDWYDCVLNYVANQYSYCG